MLAEPSPVTTGEGFWRLWLFIEVAEIKSSNMALESYYVRKEPEFW